jgi:hypothetical protein
MSETVDNMFAASTNSTATCSEEEISAQSAAVLMPAGSRRLGEWVNKCVYVLLPSNFACSEAEISARSAAVDSEFVVSALTWN